MLERFKELLFSEKELTAEAAPDSPSPRIAVCVLMLEVARADKEFSGEEREHIVATLCQRFSLSEEDAEELLLASRDTRDASYDLWKFTHQVNEAYTPTEKIRIIEEIWRVIYADGTLNAHEDYLVHKLAKLLNLNHKQLISAKMKVRREMQGAG